MKKVLLQGPISPQFISNSIEKHQSKTNIGAHDIFLGQVRNDIISGKEVTGINYTAFQKIREAAFEKFDLICMHIYHSTGFVRSGEISLFVFVSSAHREEAFQSCSFIVNEIKEKVPIFGKEILLDGTHTWKEN
ncbi:MAG TPA: molybdenum cofactor biosynthesis protein MoaE [Flavobacteriales bacterium]|nr:molybdenum cofactor biosynthesis protein MoaE [Flavobacteriales bacterium]